MKKIFASMALMFATMTSFAAGIGVQAVNDYDANKAGIRVSVAADPVGRVNPVATVTHVDRVYTRYAVGTDVNIAKLGPVAVKGNVSGVWQESAGTAPSGFGVSAGVKGEYPVARDAVVYAGVERFVGQRRTSQSNGNIASLGVSLKF